jgi:hypothetical protein
MSPAVTYSNEEVSSFVEALGQLSDDREVGGYRWEGIKRHGRLGD